MQQIRLINDLSAQQPQVLGATVNKSDKSIDVGEFPEVQKALEGGEIDAESLRTLSVSKVTVGSNKLTTEDILTRAKAAMIQVADKLAEHLELDKEKVRALLPEPEIMKEDDPTFDTHYGYYRPTENKLKLNPKYVNDEFFTPEGASSHEANHVLEAALRTCLGRDQVKRYVLSSICSEIVKGGTGLIVNDMGFIEPPAIPSREK